MTAAGFGILAVMAWAWFHPGEVSTPKLSLVPGGEPVPARISKEETPEEALARHLRAVETRQVERLEIVLEPDWLYKDQPGVDQVRVLALLYTGDETVSATGPFEYKWTRGDERPTTGHGYLQATSFRWGRLKGASQDVIFKEILRIDAPRSEWEHKTIRVEVTFGNRRWAQGSLVLEP